MKQSMPKIDFYIIHDIDPKAVLKLACKILEKAHTQNNQVYIHTPDEATAHQIDDLLWTFHDTSFIPHQLIGARPSPLPIEIGFAIEHKPDYHKDILLNIDANVPPFVGDFERIIEVVSDEPNQKEISRKKYRHYKQLGYEIKTNDLQK